MKAFKCVIFICINEKMDLTIKYINKIESSNHHLIIDMYMCVFILIKKIDTHETISFEFHLNFILKYYVHAISLTH